MRYLCLFKFTLLNLQVLYQSDQFLDKNKDYVVPEHQDLLSASKCSFVSGLFPPLPEETSKSSKFSSIGSRFKVSFFFKSLLINFRTSTKTSNNEYMKQPTKTELHSYYQEANEILNGAATTTKPDGHIKFYRTPLH